MPIPWARSDYQSAAQSEPGASRFSFEITDAHEQERSQTFGAATQGEFQAQEAESKSAESSLSLNSSGESSDRRRRREWWWQRNRIANRWWLYELLSGIVSVGCFAALVVVLRRSDGKEQTRWLYNKLTLNGLVALLSTFIRASMMLGVGACLSQMKWNHFSSSDPQVARGRRLEDLNTFDQASRGPLGSLNLIFTGTRPHLGILGALITIFTLAFDAFAQEVIGLRFQDKADVAGTTIGHVARSESYDQWTKATQETNWVNDLNTIAAEYNGIFNYQNTTAPVPQCSTGNCTWPVVSSLAVCGSCTDVTPNMTYVCVGLSEPGTPNIDYQGGGNEMNCTYTLSEGGTGYYHSEPGFTFSTSPTGSFSNGDQVLAFFVVGGYATQYYNDSTYAYIDTWLMVNASLGTITASVCGLWFCVQAYETSVSNGVPSQTVIGNWSETDISVGESYGPVNFTNVPSHIQQAANYSIDAGVLVAFEQNPIFVDDNVTYGADSIYFYEYTSTIARSLLSIADYDAWIDLFALGMSNNVRSTGTSSTPAARHAGTVLSSVPFVHVRWPWLAFPAAMVAASVVFLALCIWQTSQLHLDPWKGDALALLLASIDVEVERSSTSRWMLEREKVRLQPVDSTALFVRPVPKGL